MLANKIGRTRRNLEKLSEVQPQGKLKEKSVVLYDALFIEATYEITFIFRFVFLRIALGMLSQKRTLLVSCGSKHYAYRWNGRN